MIEFLILLVGLFIYLGVGGVVGALSTKTIAAISTWSDKDVAVWVNDDTGEVVREKPAGRYGDLKSGWRQETISEDERMHKDYFRSRMFWLRVAWPITLWGMWYEHANDKAIVKYDPSIGKDNRIKLALSILDSEAALERANDRIKELEQ